VSRPWRNREALLLGHSQMEGMAPFFVNKLRRSRVRTIHTHIERGLNLQRVQRDVRYGRRQILPPSVADELPFAIVALSGNGAVTDPRQLESNLYWLRAEYPRALIAWLGHTITRTSDAEADEERARAAELESRLVPTTLSGFVWVDMRLPSALLAGDGIHHTREGYRQLVDHAWAQILEATDRSSARSALPAILGGAALGLAGVLGYRAWQSQRDKRSSRSAEADKYDRLFAGLGEGDPWP